MEQKPSRSLECEKCNAKGYIEAYFNGFPTFYPCCNPMKGPVIYKEKPKLRLVK